MTFLEPLGVPRGAKLRLAETVLRSGAEARLSGRPAVRDRAGGDGYRGSTTVLTFRDLGDSPLVIHAAGS
jgi:hypothetical protein